MSDLSIIPSSDNAITMTSLELVEYINSQREGDRVGHALAFQGADVAVNRFLL